MDAPASHSFSPYKVGLAKSGLQSRACPISPFNIAEVGHIWLRLEKAGKGAGISDTEIPCPPLPSLSPAGRGSEMPTSLPSRTCIVVRKKFFTIAVILR